ncbi:hypothetical protein QL285_021491 [Trifolium repens]|nr:hypothetical protein QL285_021491 [Trifolium repens]
MLTKKLKRTDNGERKIEASENRSTSEVDTTMGLKKPEVESFNVKLQKNHETVKEADCTKASVTKNYTMGIGTPPPSDSPVKALPQANGNVQQPLKMKMSDYQYGDGRLKFGGVTVDSKSPETPASIVLSPKALDRKLVASCSVTVSPPPEPPDADLHATEVEVQIAGGPNMIPPPTKPPEPSDVGSPKTGLRMVALLHPQTTPAKEYATERGSVVTEGVRDLASVEKDLEKLRVNWVMCESGHILTQLDQNHNNSSKWDQGNKKWVGLQLLKQVQNKIRLLNNPCVQKFQRAKSKGKGPDAELIARHQTLQQIPSGTILKKEGQSRFIMLALNKRIKSFNLEVIWVAQEKEESCSHSSLGSEVRTTKGFVVGGGLLPRSPFIINGYAQQERYVVAFHYFSKLQYNDSLVWLNENVTHGCVVRNCIGRDVFLQTVIDKENYNFVINPTNGSCELSTNSLIVGMNGHDALIICGEGVDRSSNNKILLRGENILILINKESRERIMNRRHSSQVALASKNVRMGVMKLDLNWPVVIMLSFAIGLACGDAKNVAMEASPATNALLSLHSCIQDMVIKGHVSCARAVVIWKALIGMYGKNGECEYAFEIISLYSSVLSRQWDPGKFNVLMSVAAYEFCRRIVFISHGDGIHIVAEPYELALWNTMIWGYGSQRNLVLSFNVMSWHSSFWIIQWDPGKSKISILVSTQECTQSWKIFMQWLLIGFMSQTQIYHYHGNYNKEIENGWWFSKIQGQLVFNFSYVNRLVISWFLRKLTSLPTVVKKVIWLLKFVKEVRWRMTLIFSWIAQFVFDRGKVHGSKFQA